LSNHRLKNILDNIPFEDFEHVVINQGGWKEIVHGPFKQLHKRLKDFILVYHNYNIHDRISSGKKTALETWVNAARKNLGDALRIFSVLRDNYQLNIPRTERLFNPITFDSPARPMPYPGLINGKYQFAMLAALDTERKAQDILVRSLTGEKWKDRNWELHLYGEGKDKKSLQQLTKHLKLENRIHIHGNAKNYLEAISLSHLVLQITHIDAMPITVMEAMAVAKPVVISSVGDMPLWVTENENGWVSKEVNTECIDKTLDKAWQHRENWEAMGKKSFERFRRDFPSDPIEHFLKQIN
jgi:glycosyltransferase involved in cell wall biosynthesis